MEEDEGGIGNAGGQWGEFGRAFNRGSLKGRESGRVYGSLIGDLLAEGNPGEFVGL